MHFWIDKRSNYGIGHNRSMAGFSYQHRRIRAKSMVIPIRQHPPSVPSTSQQHVKTHHPHHHRNRLAEFEHRSPASRIHQHSAAESSSSSSSSTSHHLNHQHVPVIHSVYPRDELAINHVVDSTEIDNRIVANWLPIYIKIGFQALFLLFILVSLGICSNSQLNGLSMLVFAITCVVFFIITTTISIKRMRKNLLFEQRIRNEAFTETIVEPATNNQSTVHSVSCETIEPPPPYALAIKLPEKQSAHYKPQESPPPSYEKISIV